MWQSISPTFKDIDKFLSGYSPASFRDAKKSAEYLKYFALDKLCRQLEQDRIKTQNHRVDQAVQASGEIPFEPEYDDLCRLHYLVLTRRALTTLEFGSGFSTVVLAAAMKLLRQHFGEWAEGKVRVEQPFHVYAVEEEQQFLDITNSRLGGTLSDFATVERSSVEMILHDNRIATVYSKLPNISPDFIYLDGPSQFATMTEINGISIAHMCRMPMAADLLRLEFFLEPGTLILVDGRTANSRFLKAYFKRNWAYEHDPIGDIHYFELQEEPLGKFNKLKLDFCLGGDWLLK